MLLARIEIDDKHVQVFQEYFVWETVIVKTAEDTS